MHKESYKIVKSRTIEDLVELVNAEMHDDYQPLGGVNSNVVMDMEEFYQALLLNRNI